jgi:hypothetical protein
MGWALMDGWGWCWRVVWQVFIDNSEEFNRMFVEVYRALKAE